MIPAKPTAASPLTDELVLKAIAGDSEAIATLLKAAQNDIRRYARRSCRRTIDFEDAVQETLIVLYRKIGTLREVGALAGWLFRIETTATLMTAEEYLQHLAAGWEKTQSLIKGQYN